MDVQRAAHDIQRLIRRDTRAGLNAALLLTKTHPDDPAALYALATAQRFAGLAADALATLQRLERDHSFDQLHQSLGWAYRRLGRYPEALSAFLCAMAITPDMVSEDGQRLIAKTISTALLAGQRPLARSIAQKHLTKRAPCYVATAAYFAEPPESPKREVLAKFILSQSDAIPIAGFWKSTDTHIARQLDDKAELTRILRDENGQAPDWYPETFILPEDASRLTARGHSGNYWMFKSVQLTAGAETALVRGDHIHTVKEGLTRRVAQRYTANPFLYHGRKVNLRLYIVLRSAAERALYQWHDGLVTICATPYPRMDGDTLAGHIANPLILSETEVNTPIGTLPSHVCGLNAFMDAAFGPDDRRILTQRLEQLVRDLSGRLDAHGFYDRYAALPHPDALPPKLMALDIGIDSDLKPYLYEVEVSPGMVPVGPIWTDVTQRLAQEWRKLTFDFSKVSFQFVKRF
ncbi:hypothetical protein FHS89_002026 [Rubricella aquisinus]|uniref:Tetratricopeptide repeat protein n=1 Tax=Rubricella aquisinus TaxID=2028108 RepID=A0A840X2C7_9RHOB|nr:hypothetical protein [Rubricella aquisinus]MBB5516006.1 hypothetical protein [Rubricella aquisinus]